MPTIKVERDSYHQSLHNEIQDLKEYSIQEYDIALTTSWDPKALSKEIQAALPDSPLWEFVLNEDADGIGDHRSELVYKALDVLKTDFDAYKDLRSLQRRVDSYYQFLDSMENPRDLDDEYTGYEVHARELEEQTTKGVVAAIDSAIDRSVGFSSAVVVEPLWSKGSWDKAPTTYTVSFGKDSYAPSFTLFLKDGGDIDSVEDVLEGGDDDFFKDPKQQYDYFNLVNEIRKPGSTSKGKLMRLYTARPIKDRSRYESASTVPVNIFMASTFDEAEGLATDLGGSEQRDVWKVVIDSRYLVQTLEGSVKHYQTVGPDRSVPVKYMELVSPGRRLARSTAVGWSGDAIILDVWSESESAVRLSLSLHRGTANPFRLDLLDKVVGAARTRGWKIVVSQTVPGFILWTFYDVPFESVKRYAQTLIRVVDPYVASLAREKQRQSMATRVAKRCLKS